MPAAGAIGTLGRRIFDGPWDTTFNLAVNKNFKLTERNVPQLRVIGQNILNHPTFAIGDQTATSTTFGKITGTVRRSAGIPVRLVLRLLNSASCVSAPKFCVMLNGAYVVC